MKSLYRRAILAAVLGAPPVAFAQSTPPTVLPDVPPAVKLDAPAVTAPAPKPIVMPSPIEHSGGVATDVPDGPQIAMPFGSAGAAMDNTVGPQLAMPFGSGGAAMDNTVYEQAWGPARALTASAPRHRATLADIVNEPVQYLFSQDGHFRVRGWLNAGSVYNSANPNSKYNGPYNAVDRNQEPLFNQSYTIMELGGIPTDGTFGVGGRLDMLFGTDALLAQSLGLEVGSAGQQRWNGTYYGLALPQMYLQAGVDCLSVKAGHFYSLVGYEGIPADGNFFYTHSYSYMFAGPFTHWGWLVNAKPNDNWEYEGGLVNGWNTLNGAVNEVNYMGRLRYTPDDKTWWSSFAVISGDQFNNVAQLPGIRPEVANRTRYSFLMGLTPGGPCGRLEYVFHYFHGFQANGTAAGSTAQWYGIDQYLFYRLTSTLRLGTRFEWMRDEDGTRVGLNRETNPNKAPLPGHYFSLTGGFNYSPCANVTIRPEIRYDFTSDLTRLPFADGTNRQQLLLAADVILRY